MRFILLLLVLLATFCRFGLADKNDGTSDSSNRNKNGKLTRKYPGQDDDGVCNGSNDSDGDKDGAPTTTVQGNGTIIYFVGKSGQIKIQNTTTCEFVKLKWDRLEEIDINRRVLNKVNSFASQKLLDWSQPVSGLWNGIAYKRIDIAGGVQLNDNKQQVKLNISVIIFGSDTIIPNGNSSTYIPIRGGQVKFTIQISNWPFVSTSSRLRFGVSFTNGGGRGDSDNKLEGPENDDDDNRAAKKYNTSLAVAHVGPGKLGSPLLGFADNRASNITCEKNDPDDGKFGVAWIFPYFNNTLYYDPVFAAFDSTAPATATTAVGSASSLYFNPTLIPAIFALHVIITAFME